jgi:hypothetical protein
LIALARADQAVENFDNCYEHAKDARYAIVEPLRAAESG